MSDDDRGRGDEEQPPSRASSPTRDPEDLAASALDTVEDTLPDCPRCGRTVWLVSVTGPTEGTAGPCGCTVAPGLLERD